MLNGTSTASVADFSFANFKQAAALTNYVHPKRLDGFVGRLLVKVARLVWW